MRAQAQCPACHTEFPVSGNRSYEGLIREMFVSKYRSPEDQIRNSSRVQCPHCGELFQSSAVRYFGILGPKGMRNLVIAIVLLVAAFWFYMGKR